MKKITVIIGTRPEAIKLAPVVLALQAEQEIECKVCVTGQHREMLYQVLHTFNIVADIDLNLMQVNQNLSNLTARAIESIEIYLTKERPDMVLVQGDTTTAFCAALTAFYHKIPIGHVEAGLRTGDLYSPWPEEANRTLIARLATLQFAPTRKSRDNLRQEGVALKKIFVTGNTGIDALFMAIEKVRTNPPEIPGLPRSNDDAGKRDHLVLITGHRRENFGEGLESICKAIVELARCHPHVQFVYPVHMNPNVRVPVQKILGVASTQNIHLIEPVSYIPFVALMARSTIILTDSGGIQEEAPSLGKPVLVMRNTTERPEAVTAGTAKLVRTECATIVEETSRLITDAESYRIMARAHNPYGDGKAAGRIVRACFQYLGDRRSERKSQSV